MTSLRLGLYAFVGLLVVGLIFGLSLAKQKFNRRVGDAAAQAAISNPCLAGRYRELRPLGAARVERDHGRATVNARLLAAPGQVRVRSECAVNGEPIACRPIESLDVGGHRLDLGACREIDLRAPAPK